jgi:hypothetical protein
MFNEAIGVLSGTLYRQSDSDRLAGDPFERNNITILYKTIH